jgi:predicted O-methyltransferase YrrM
MRDYEFNYNTLYEFSNSDPYENVDESLSELFNDLNTHQKNLNFPAINNDVGSFLQVMLGMWAPKRIFEMGSGYGHSAFWFLSGDEDFLEKIYLTERRTDLESIFHSLPWPKSWKEKIEYHQADAFEVLKTVEDIDLALIDGVKSDYLKCLKVFESKMIKGGIVLIDNSYWRGSFLSEEVCKEKDSAQKIKELHEYIKQSKTWKSTFVPFKDGLTILKKL